MRITPQDRVWYRRTFSLHPAQEGSRWLLHFGAVDWESEVFLNGRSLGIHRGGYDPFSFDVTEALVAEGPNELMVAVWDPTNEGSQPRGKQVLEPRGIWYTAVTGIWQTVWLEPVPETHVTRLAVHPHPEAGTVDLTVEASGEDNASFRATVTGPGAPPVQEVGRAGEPVTLTIPEPRLWSPDDPFLYDLHVALEGGDEVESYFGLRTIQMGRDEDGHRRLLLNGQPLFQYGLLDQGWWPDGLYTAPTDEALRFDVTQTKALGFNLIRKHVKVEPARWYYHCDREGVLVWQDMPSADNETPESREEFAAELEAVVGFLKDHPSIVMWVPFNEGWGQHDTESYVARLQELDATRLVNNASGWTDRGVGHVLDVHRYPGPGAPNPEDLEGRVAVLGEFGGLGLPLGGHTWVEEDNWGYRSYETLEELNVAYRDLLLQLRPLIGEGLASAVYTQTTDVEIEVNGVMTYDREVVKLDEASVEANLGLYGPPPTLRPLLPTSRREPQRWRYTLQDPGAGWEGTTFDDAGWLSGPGGFGTEGTPGAVVRTAWDSSEIWLRRAFELPEGALAPPNEGAQEGPGPGSLLLRIHHDEDAEVYLNGTLIATLEGYTTGYRLIHLGPEEAALLAPGPNLLAIHVRQTDGGQFIDAGIVRWIEGGGS
jgi:hypothetical protein